jgi:hypothetical protein
MDRCDPPTNGGGVYRDRSLGQSEAEDAVEGLEDLFEVVPSVGVVRRISRSSGRGEDGLAAPGLVLFGEGLVGLNGADGGDEVAPIPGCGDGTASPEQSGQLQVATSERAGGLESAREWRRWSSREGRPRAGRRHGRPCRRRRREGPAWRRRRSDLGFSEIFGGNGGAEERGRDW